MANFQKGSRGNFLAQARNTEIVRDVGGNGAPETPSERAARLKRIEDAKKFLEEARQGRAQYKPIP